MFRSPSAAPASVEPEEIRAYQDERNAPGDIGLETHGDYVATGCWTFDWAIIPWAMSRRATGIASVAISIRL